MKLVFYSLFLNHHQACVADEFYKILGDNYAFVELSGAYDSKGATEDYSKRPYLVKAWESAEAWQKAMDLAETAEVCVFGGYEALPFEKARMKRGLLSFDMGERMLKRGWLNLASPRILKMIMAYHLGGWNKKSLYKLCMSAFTKQDQYRLRSFKDKCFKWGYFTSVEISGCENFVEASTDVSTSGIAPLMWCSRYLMWKHPELPVQMAKRLKDKGYRFLLSMYGDEGMAAKHDGVYPKVKLESLIAELGVGDCVRLMGNRPNNEILEAMRKSDIFLFTSDRLEGWGAVANESMANGCALVASDAIGSSPYLIENGFNGFMFKSCDVESLTEKVEWLLTHPENLVQMKRNAYERMRDVWSPRCAAKALLQLIEDLKCGNESSLLSGPCSKA